MSTERKPGSRGVLNPFARQLANPAERIGSTISALYAGIDAATFEDAGERYDVRVQIRPEDRDDIAKLATGDDDVTPAGKRTPDRLPREAPHNDGSCR